MSTKAKAVKISVKGAKKSSDKKKSEHTRFGISLIMLMALLIVSVFFLLLTLIQVG